MRSPFHPAPAAPGSRASGPAALLLAGLVAACSGGDDAPAPAQAPPAAAPLPYLFTDITAESGLGSFRQINGEKEKPWVLESFGAGVALFDADNDGDLDAYLTNGGMLEGLAPGEEPRDALYRNDGAARFEDVTAQAGLGDRHWTYGVRTVDLDGDGDVEPYLSNWGRNVLYDNLGDGTFVDVSARSGADDPGWSTGAAFLDFDRDGDLDLYVANYLEFEREAMLRENPRATMRGHSRATATGQALEQVLIMKGPMGLQGSRDQFYRNGGDGRFANVSDEVGISGPERYSFQVLTFDADLDGWLDVLVVNDVVEDLLWHNEAGQRFSEVSLQAGVAVRSDGVPQGGMGGAVGDYDGDLLTDLFVANFYEDYSTLFHGLKGGFFSDVTTRMGLRNDTWSMVGWACGFVDFDSDGDQELFQINGHTFPQVDEVDLGTSYFQKNQLWELQDGRYVRPRGGGGPPFDVARAGRGAALGDIDGDGDQDLLIGNIDDQVTLLRNDSPGGQRLLVLLVGQRGNREAIGARMVLRTGERRLLRLVGSNSGFLSSHDPREHFGLGQARSAEELEVTWPDGRTERFTGLAAGHLHTIEDGGGEKPARLSSTPLPAWPPQ